MKKITLALLLSTGLFAADAYQTYFTQLIKTAEGFHLKQVKTYYAGRIIWGEGWTRHVADTGVTYLTVEVFGEGWAKRGSTDADGNFKLEVRPDSPFSIRASDGNEWLSYEGTLGPIALGTVGTDKAAVNITAP